MLFSFLIKTCGKRVTLIEWKKEKKANDKAQQEFESSFLIQLGIWFKASSASSPVTSFFPRFPIEASAKREWLMTTSTKGPAASYFIRWHMAYN